MTITTTDRAPERAGRRKAVAVLWAVLLLWSAAWSTAQAADAFSVREATTHLEDEVYLLDAEVLFDLSDEALEALESGVSLTFELEIQVLRPRWGVWDERIAGLSQRYRLTYHALSRQYVVVNLNTAQQRSFPTRGGAQRYMGRLKDFPMLDRRLLKVGESYHGRLRARLDIESLPAPLRPLAYLSSKWRLSSGWYEWPL